MEGVEINWDMYQYKYIFFSKHFEGKWALLHQLISPIYFYRIILRLDTLYFMHICLYSWKYFVIQLLLSYCKQLFCILLQTWHIDEISTLHWWRSAHMPSKSLELTNKNFLKSRFHINLYYYYIICLWKK